MGDALDLRRRAAIVAGVFLLFLSSVGRSAQRDLFVFGGNGSASLDVALSAFQSPSAPGLQGQDAASRWGQWTCVLRDFTNESCQRADITGCQPCCLLATDVARLPIGAGAAAGLQADLGFDDRGHTFLSGGEAPCWAHFMMDSEESGAAEPCAVPFKVFLPDLGYECFESGRQDMFYFGSDFTGSQILR